MQPLNYCRQMSVSLAELLTRPGIQKAAVSDPGFINDANTALALSAATQKFMLPEGGHTLLDFTFKALDRDEELKLPFPEIALEYARPGNSAPKRIVFVTQDEGGLGCQSVVFLDEWKVWQPYPPFFIKNGNFLDDSEKLPHGVMYGVTDGDAAKDLQYELYVVLGFLNALACSNVAVERGPAPKQGAKLKNSLPFDVYHTLVLRGPKNVSESTSLGGHRSPREHLRRGHIRRLESGAKVWVNATVVNAGAPGKVVKDYRFG